MSASEADHHNESYPLALPDISGVVPTSAEARAKRRIAVLEDELENMKQERRGKQRFVVSHSGHVVCSSNLAEKRPFTFLKAGLFAAWASFTPTWRT